MAEQPKTMSSPSVEPSIDGVSARIAAIPASDLSSNNAMSQPQPAFPPLTEQSRIAERSAIAHAEGIAIHDFDDNDIDEAIDDDDEGFVAVDHEDVDDYSWYFRRPPPKKPTKLDELHPFVQLLSLSNVDDCLAVEAAFPEQERSYRLTKCPELSLGIFSLPVKQPDQPKPQPKLVAHILATRTPALRVTDASMGLPPNWQDKTSTLGTSNGSEPLGHQDQGSTIALHSLAVLPEHQGKRLGTTLLKAYTQRIKDAQIADRIALLAHEHLIPFYTGLGFENQGLSDCTFGGGGWYSLVLEFSDAPEV
ncbi:hypothetical protein FQN50_008243 [Emmonsiellopsis sp. PD_5]|nr:hypothetical protein FQN50_008243 [Emmonsiellopsis sp. PD_5]